MIFFTLVIAAALLLTVYVWKVYSRFKGYGVKYNRPVPFLGDISLLALKKVHFVDLLQWQYNSFPEERFIGRFELMRPVIMIRDPALIKQVTVEDYEHFLNHRDMVDKTVDPLFGNTMFCLKDQEWKDMRSTMSPAFTTSKIRAMLPFMVQVSDQMINMLKNKIKLAESGYIDIDSKDLVSRCSNDVMASCGFGLNMDSHAQPNNEFYLQAKSTAHMSFRRIMVFLGYTSFPKVMKKLNIKFFKENANDYFNKIFTDTILERERNNIVRPDIIHILMKAKTGNQKNIDHQCNDAGFANMEESEVGKRTVSRSWSDIELTAQAIFFFLASVETISAAMCFALYELAVNPDIQERLHAEFMAIKAKSEALDYDSIQKLSYLDMVISEVLRLWPLGVDLDRLCTKDYNLGKPNDKAPLDYVIKRGELVSVPVWSIHRDPKNYPNPEKFDPERFSEQNKASIKPCTYLPFGSGPRCCLASRFVLYEMKVLIYHLLIQFQLSPAEKTRIPVKLQPGALLPAMEGGHWLRLTSRT